MLESIVENSIRLKIDTCSKIAELKRVKTLASVIEEVDQLSDEEQAGLVAHILARLPDTPLGPSDVEVARREAEIDAGTAKLITHEELCRAVGR